LQNKMNREIRDYKENMFFGLSLRQCVFSVIAVAVAIALYFFLQPHVGTEAVSWLCVIGAAPFAALGFVTYNRMTAEQFLWAYLQSEILMPKALLFEQRNLYYDILETAIKQNRKKGVKKHGVQITETDTETA